MSTKRPTSTPRPVNARRWSAAGSVFTASIIAAAPFSLAAAGMQDDAAHNHLKQLSKTTQHIMTAANESGEGGEGGGTADFLADLGFIEGHLRAGATLFRQGHGKMAATHMKHPADEIYTDLEPALKQRGIEGFAAELEALANAVKGNDDQSVVDKAFEAIVARLDEARASADASASEKLKAMVNLSRTAAAEYEVGVVEHKISNMHEYQDAWGFLQVVERRANELAASDDPDAQNAAKAFLAELSSLGGSFPKLMPEGEIDSDASVLFGAAARMELAALKVK